MLYNFFSRSTQLSMEFKLLIKRKMQKNKDLSTFKLSDVVYILLINVKMQTILLINVKIPTNSDILTLLAG